MRATYGYKNITISVWPFLIVGLRRGFKTVWSWINNSYRYHALAIGLLVGVLDNPDNVLQFVIWFIAGFSFLFCGGLILIIFRQNTKYIETLLDDHQTEEKAEEKVVLSEREKQKTQQLGLLTKSAFLLFLFGEKALE